MMMMMMKSLFYVFTIIVALQAAVLPYEHLNKEWETFKTKFNKKYTSPLVEVSRRLVWEQNVRNIQIHNIEYDLGKKSFSMGVNEYTDMTHKEFKSIYLGYKTPTNITRHFEYTFRAPMNFGDLPEYVDWRTKGFVTPVKNQGQCGSCYSYSATGSLEGQHRRVSGKLVALSQQQIIDCSGLYGNKGCGGGTMDYTFNYVKDKGLEAQSVYPDSQTNYKCVYNRKEIVTTCKGFVDIKYGSEDDLKKAVATVGPISIGIDASDDSFMSYKGGIYDEPGCVPYAVDHGVLLVGYGEENGKKYWLVKNSWGTSWGEKGYIKMSRDKNNQCGIASMASYPIV